jgi:hypothetical protein
MDLANRVILMQDRLMGKEMLYVAVILVAHISVAERDAIEREANWALSSEGVAIRLYELGQAVPSREPVLVYDHTLRNGVLGQTHRSNGEWLGIVDIDLLQIKNRFGLKWRRVYARVLAHEIWHWATRSDDHNACGLFAERVPHALLAADALLACASPRPLLARAF